MFETINKKIKKNDGHSIINQIIINKKIEDLNDLIKIAELYNPSYNYNIKLDKLFNIIPVLKELNNVIGMEAVKKNIINQIVFCVCVFIYLFIYFFVRYWMLT